MFKTETYTPSYLDFGWLSGDVVAGLTVGIVAVPQSMSYAMVSLISYLRG